MGTPSAQRAAQPVLAWPLPGPAEVRRGFAPAHEGIDLVARRGTPVLAPAGGVVVAAGPAPGFVCPLDGRWVDDQLTVRIAWTVAGGGRAEVALTHLDQVDVVAGQRVEQGAPVGLSGSTGCATGPHLHLALGWSPQPTAPMRSVKPSLAGYAAQP